MWDVSCTAPATLNTSLQLFNCPTPAILFKTAAKLSSDPMLECPKVVQTCGACNILTWKCDSRRCVHFLNSSTSKSVPRRRFVFTFWFSNVLRTAVFDLLSRQMAPHPPFSEPTFRPSGAPKHWINTVFRDCTYFFDPFRSFSRNVILFLLTLSPLALPAPVAASVHALEVWLLNPLRLITQ